MIFLWNAWAISWKWAKEWLHKSSNDTASHKPFVTRYSKTYLTVLATNYWFGMNKGYYSVISAHQSFQESMVQAQYCVTVWRACLIPLFWNDPTPVMRVYYPLQVFIIDWFLMIENQTQVEADLRYLLL